jgi:hypothetical protein
MKLTKKELKQLIREQIFLIETDNTFRNYINPYVRDNMYYPPHNLGYSRINMPQIEDNLQLDFFKYLTNTGVKFDKKNITIGNIKPAQKDLRVDVATNLLKSGSVKLKKPLLISSDNYLMDGHHRWLALMFDNPKQKLNVVVINVKGKSLLQIMRKFDKVEFKSSQ